MIKQYRVKLLLSKRWIKTDADVVDVSYIVNALNREQAVDLAYEIAYQDYPLLTVIRTQTEPLYKQGG